MKKKIIYGLLFAVAMVTASSSFVSCKDYEGDDYADLKERLYTASANSQTTIDELIRLQQAQIQYQIDNLKDALARMQASAEKTNAEKISEDAQAALDALMTKYNSASTLDDKLTILSEMNKILMQVTGTSGGSSTINVPSATEAIIFMWGDSLRNAYATAYDAYVTANVAYITADKADRLAHAADSLSKDNKARLDALKLYADSLFDRANFLADSALQVAKNDIVNNYINKLDSAYKAGDEKLADLINKLDSAYKAGDKELADVINKLDSAYKAGDKELADMINKLDIAYKEGDSVLTVRCNDIEAGYKKADAALQKQIDALNQDVDALNQKVENILGTLKKQISGVIIQGTYSPVFGYGSLPLGIQTNILAAYVGTALTDVQFPSAMKSFDNKYIITETDQEWLESKGMMPAAENITAGQLLINDEEGNAGKMFLTVNPTNVDFSGTDFKLVNSKGEESRIQLSTLDASDEVLSFGWTRGTTVGNESANGFYEVTATISKEDALKMQPRIDKAGFKEAVMEATDCQTCTSVKQVARALYNSLEPVDRFGVKAEWQDPVVGNRSVTSAYDIAAMSIKPLGFGFRLPGQIFRLPTIDKKVIAEKYHVDWDIDPIIITEYDKATGKYVVKVEYKNGSSTETTDLDLTDLFEEVYGEVNAKLAEFNKTGESVNKQIDNIAAKVNSYIDCANGWISRVNNLLDNIGNAVQPVLIWCDGEKAGELGGFVSANYAVGTIVPKGGQLALIPTSYSLELFAPAYKKSLIVTNAYKGGFTAQGSAGKASGLEDAVIALNNDIKAQGFDVFSGTSLKNQYIFNSEGYEGITFEIAYTAVDYEGKIAGRKFYLTVGE